MAIATVETPEQINAREAKRAAQLQELRAKYGPTIGLAFDLYAYREYTPAAEAMAESVLANAIAEALGSQSQEIRARGVLALIHFTKAEIAPVAVRANQAARNFDEF